jgi:hypothetical protein
MKYITKLIVKGKSAIYITNIDDMVSSLHRYWFFILPFFSLISSSYSLHVCDSEGPNNDHDDNEVDRERNMNGFFFSPLWDP